mgnify:CR=1 FL=1
MARSNAERWNEEYARCHRVSAIGSTPLGPEPVCLSLHPGILLVRLFWLMGRFYTRPRRRLDV